MSLEEGREYYRNHPVMKLVTELLLKTSVQFSLYPTLLIEKVIIENGRKQILRREDGKIRFNYLKRIINCLFERNPSYKQRSYR